MDYYTIQVLSMFIIFPAIAGLVRFKKVSPVFYPFLYIIWFGFINDVYSNVIVELGYYTILNYNINILIQSFLLLWLFRKWHLFGQSSKLYYCVFIFYGLLWALETIFISRLLLAYNSYFRITYSFITVLMSVSVINYLLVKETRLLIKNSIFIICCAFILFYSLAAVSEVFFVYGLQLSNSFMSYVNRIIVITNLLCNLIYTLAILWMPKREAFTLQY